MSVKQGRFIISYSMVAFAMSQHRLKHFLYSMFLQDQTKHWLLAKGGLFDFLGLSLVHPSDKNIYDQY